MPEEKDEGSGFKVVDRRPFSADGTRREAPAQEAEKPPAAASREASLRPPAPKGEEEQDFEEGAAGFDTLVSYLSTTAMFQLGMLAGPSGERIPVDLVNAHRTIDLLEILQQKTQGNLTPDEARLLDDVLYELRLTYVEVEKRLPKRPK